jgi:serine/threonine-protein kinase
MRVLIAVGVCTLVACSSDSTPSGGPDGSMTDGTMSGGDGSMNNGDSGNGSDGSMMGNDGGGGGTCPADFPATSIFYQDISNAPVDGQWNTIKAVLANGWGNAFQLDPSFEINCADGNVARRPFTQDPGAMPDCDTAPVPVPPGGKIEGEKDYFCSSGGDCHMLVYQGTRLYELYQGSISGGQYMGGTFTGSCLVVWDLTKDYWKAGNPYSRGDGCNGADAADVPIAPLLLKKAEIAAHSIKHAMRFTIGNPKIDNTYYVHPATHLGGSGTPMQTIPYGARFRLKSTFNVQSLPNAEAQAIAVALQKYGMFMDDGGGFYVSATTDITSVVAPQALKALLPTDFEMVEGGTRINYHQQNCTRTVITN